MGSLPVSTNATFVLIDPRQPKRVYAGDGTTLSRSDDAGETWQTAVQGLPNEEIATLALDPRQPQRLYAMTASGTVYVSEDGATSWLIAGAATPYAGA